MGALLLVDFQTHFLRVPLPAPLALVLLLVGMHSNMHVALIRERLVAIVAPEQSIRCVFFWFQISPKNVILHFKFSNKIF